MKKVLVALLILLVFASAVFVFSANTVSANPTGSGVTLPESMPHGTLNADFGTSKTGDHPWGGEE